MRLDEKQIEVVDEEIAEILKKKTPAERLRIAFNLWEMAHQMMTHHLKFLHPEWEEKKIRREVASRMSHGAV